MSMLVTPRMLPCLHTFCEQCIHNIVHSGDTRCPSCRNIFVLPEAGLVGFPRNFIVDDLILNMTRVVARLRYSDLTAITLLLTQQSLVSYTTLMHALSECVDSRPFTVVTLAIFLHCIIFVSALIRSDEAATSAIAVAAGIL